MIKVYGKNCINEVIRANIKDVLEVFILDTISKKEERFIEMLKDKKIKYSILPKNKMDQLFSDKHQGFGCYRKDYEMCELSRLTSIKKTGRRLVVLDGIQDPHNLGAILRSCDAFGIDGIILPKNRSVSVTATVAHVSTGAIEYVPICLVNSLNTTIKVLKDEGFWIVGTDAAGNVAAKDIDKSLDLAIIIGSEGFGMSKSLVKDVDYLLSIPMVGHVNSLNASVSAGIVLHDLMN